MAALPYEYDNAAIVFVTVAPASLLASSYIVNSYLRWSEVRTPAFSLVFAMAVADIFYGIKFIVTGADRLLDTQTGLLSGASPACTALGILGQLAGMATLSYNGAIAVNVYFTLERPFRYKPELWVPRYHGFVAALCVVTAATIAALQQYGPSYDASCWIAPEPHGRLLMIIVWLIPNTVYIVGAVFVLFRVSGDVYCAKTCRRGRVVSAQLNETKRRALVRLVEFTIVFVIGWSSQLAITMYVVAGGQNAPEWLTVLVTVFNCSTGLLNGLVWARVLRARAKRAKTLRKTELSGSYSDRDEHNAYGGGGGGGAYAPPAATSGHGSGGHRGGAAYAKLSDIASGDAEGTGAPGVGHAGGGSGSGGIHRGGLAAGR